MPDKLSDSQYSVNRESDSDIAYPCEMELGERIRRLRRERGLTQIELLAAVRRLGGELSQGQLSAIENGEVERPTMLVELAQALGTDPVALLKGLAEGEKLRHPANSNTNVTKKLPEPAPEVRFLRQTGARRDRKRTLPVWASAEGGQGAWVVDDEPIAYIETPANLIDVTGAFAVRLIGNSAVPRYEHDDVLLINPSRQIQPGDWCLFLRENSAGEKHAAVKKLVRRTAKVWVVEQLNPPDRLEFARAEWQKAFKIVGTLTDR